MELKHHTFLTLGYIEIYYVLYALTLGESVHVLSGGRLG